LTGYNTFSVASGRVDENALALTKLDEARLWLLERTRERDGRGVEGTHRA